MKDAEKKDGKKGFWTLLKESIAKSNDGCGPGCGCHAGNEKNASSDEVKGDAKTKRDPDVRP